ncbi:MAG TPA: VWA domain-containing protein [Kofleriaceae bacterium]|nr:VWA domain-containing protein [Kofleriaceae bacterium]
MTFEHPLWLLSIVPALALAVLDARRRWPATRRRRALAVAGRVIVIAALAGAAATPRCTRHHRAAVVVFLIDRSASVGDDALAAAWRQASGLRDRLGAGDRAGAILFDAEAEVAVAPGDAWAPPPSWRGAGRSRDATDLAGAIRLGLGLIPPGAAGHLVVLGDGRDTTSELAAATAAAVARGVPVSVIPSAPVTGDPAVAAIVLDADRVRPGATVAGRVELDAGGVTGRGVLTVRVAGEPALTQDVTLAGGRTEVRFTHALPPARAPGVAAVEAELTLLAGTVDHDRDNDRAATPFVVDAAPRILILDGDDGGTAPLAAALRAEQMDVTIVAAGDDGPAPDLTDVDLVILSNAPVRGGVRGGVLDDELGERLVKWADDGGGLLVLGGPSAFDGAYAANRLADALPVELEPTDPEVDAAATVIVILDQSGSMGAEVGGRTKLALAAEGAAAVIRLLRSFDRVGVMAVEDVVNWVVKVRTIGGDTAALERQVRNIPVGGDGIFVYTSLVAARKALADSPTPLRHVILFSDTTDAAEQVKGIDYGDFVGWPSARADSFDVARELRAMGATLSVIGVGDGTDRAWAPGRYFDDDDDTDFLRQLAAEGGGRYYRTSNARALRALFVQDAQRLLDNNAREEDVRVEVATAHPALDGVDLAAAPPLHGYQEVKPRPAAQVVIKDRAGYPILTRWPYGLGEVAVWASDAGPRWAGDWLRWPGYARLWTQVVRAALRRHEGDAIAVEIAFARDTATVRVVDRGDAGALTARVVGDGRPRPLPLAVVEPGVREARLNVSDARTAVVEIVDGAGAVVARRAVVRPAPIELRRRGADVEALTALATATGGRVDPPAIVPAGGSAAPVTTSLALWFVLAAVIALPLDAALRRPARERD